ncbi:MAG TPA: hypothetical protein PLY43_00225 [Ruminococcus sp.]|nr:hypothetical protein [Ruminococcus sp.]
MSYEIRITAEELFFLGEVLQADHLDYSYIAMMHDIEKNYDLISDKSFRELAGKKIIRKKLRGDISVVPEAEALLKNIFEGGRSASLEVYHQAEEVTREDYRFHFGDNGITEVIIDNDTLILKSCTMDEITSLIRSKVGNTSDKGKELSYIDPDDVQTLVSVIVSDLSLGVQGTEVYEIEGALYTSVEDERIKNLSGVEASALLINTMRGGSL